MAVVLHFPFFDFVKVIGAFLHPSLLSQEKHLEKLWRVVCLYIVIGVFRLCKTQEVWCIVEVLTV